MIELPYDKYSKESILDYAEKLVDKTFKDVLDSYPLITDELKETLYKQFNSSSSKGSLGNLLEEYYFYYPPTSKPVADFEEAGVELKVTPYLINKKGELRAKERLVLTMIDFMEDYKYPFEESHLYQKCALMLIINYLYSQDTERINFPIKFVNLFSFPEADLEIIKQDYNVIINKIKAGKAHEISEGDTNYLGACPKGANKDSVRKQPFSNELAMQRAFCLKNSYMTYVLNNYIASSCSSESLIKDASVLKTATLEEYILSKLSRYYGKDILYLKDLFGIPYSTSHKAFTYYLAKNMLEVVNDRIEEFEKANIKIKAIRVNKNNMPKEAMSFPSFKYTEIINEEWETSELYTTFSETKYLFMIYEIQEDESLTFKKAMFWNVPTKDLNTEIKKVWTETVERIKSGEYEHLPKAIESPILHVRPHAANAEDVYPTPDGGSAVKKCFWLNREYIKKQIIKSED